MNKRLVGFLLCLILLSGLAVPVHAVEDAPIEVIKISVFTAEDFLEFAENCRLDSFSRNLEVTLEENIDLSDSSFEGIPVFCGVFKGKGHTISGVQFIADGSIQGLFRYLTEDAVVWDLVVEGTYHPEGSRN